MARRQAAAQQGNPAQAGGSTDQGSSLQEKESALDEVMEQVETIDYTRDPKKARELEAVISRLTCPHPSLQWRAAEVVARCVQNNASVQKWFLDRGVLPLLLGLLHSTNTSASRTSADRSAEQAAEVLRASLLAVSGLVQHNALALRSAMEAGLPKQLAALCANPDQRVQKRAMLLATYVSSMEPQAVAELLEGGALDAAVNVLRLRGAVVAGSDLRTRALNLILQLAQTSTNGLAAVRRYSLLPACLAFLNDSLEDLAQEDRSSCRDEKSAINSLFALLNGPHQVDDNNARTHLQLPAQGDVPHRDSYMPPDVPSTAPLEGGHYNTTVAGRSHPHVRSGIRERTA